MSEQVLHTVDPTPEHPAGAVDAVTFDLEHPPVLVGAKTLAAIWGVSVSQIYRRIRHGEFDFLKTEHPVGPKQFSGVVLARFLKREPLYQSSFGRKRSA